MTYRIVMRRGCVMSTGFLKEHTQSPLYINSSKASCCQKNSELLNKRWDTRTIDREECLCHLEQIKTQKKKVSKIVLPQTANYSFAKNAWPGLEHSQRPKQIDWSSLARVDELNPWWEGETTNFFQSVQKYARFAFKVGQWNKGYQSQTH